MCVKAALFSDKAELACLWAPAARRGKPGDRTPTVQIQTREFTVLAVCLHLWQISYRSQCVCVRARALVWREGGASLRRAIGELADPGPPARPAKRRRTAQGRAVPHAPRGPPPVRLARRLAPPEQRLLRPGFGLSQRSEVEGLLLRVLELGKGALV